MGLNGCNFTVADFEIKPGNAVYSGWTDCPAPCEEMAVLPAVWHSVLKPTRSS